MCVCVCVRACVRACVRVRACVHACGRVCVCGVSLFPLVFCLVSFIVSLVKLEFISNCSSPIHFFLFQLYVNELTACKPQAC